MKSKDLGIKIGTPKEVLWTKFLEEAKYLIKQSEEHLIIQTVLKNLAESMIAEEKEKLK